MLRKLRDLLPFLLSLIIILGFAYYIFQNAEQYQTLLDFSVGPLILLALLSILGRICYGIINYIVYRVIDTPVTFNESLGLAAVNSLANHLPFSGGIIAKGAYLKRRYQLTYTRFLSVTLALYLFFLSANGVTGVIVLAYLSILKMERVSGLVIAGFGLMAGSIFFLFLPIERIQWRGFGHTSLRRLIEGWQALKQNRKAIAQLVGLQVITTILFAFRLLVAFRLLSQDVSFANCLIFSSATVLTQLVAITPGGLGVRELIVAGIAATAQIDPAISVVAVGLDRLIATAVIFSLGAFYSYLLGKNMLSENEVSVAGKNHQS